VVGFSVLENAESQTVAMNDPALDQLTCTLARRLYRMQARELEETESGLLRLLELLRHYRRLHLDTDKLPRDRGAAHLCSGLKGQ
jgi:hypothetical protein